MDLFRGNRLEPAVPDYAGFDGIRPEHANAQRALAGRSSPVRPEDAEGIRMASFHEPFDFFLKWVQFFFRVPRFLFFLYHAGSIM